MKIIPNSDYVLQSNTSFLNSIVIYFNAICLLLRQFTTIQYIVHSHIIDDWHVCVIPRSSLVTICLLHHKTFNMHITWSCAHQILTNIGFPTHYLYESHICNMHFQLYIVLSNIDIYCFTFIQVTKKKAIACLIVTNIPSIGTLFFIFFSCIACHFLVSCSCSIAFSCDISAPNSMKT
jgi:hypothetical protein